MRRFFFGLIIIILFPIIGLSQILNVEQQRIVTDTTGWAGSISLATSASQFTKTLFSFNGNAHAQYKNDKNLALFILNYTVVNADGESFDDRGYAHFRYNHEFNDLFRGEIFTQIQSNSLLKVNQRTLLGIGPRLKLSQYENAKFYFGLAYMYEYEVLKDNIEINSDHRLSSYFTFTLVPQEVIKLTNTTYIQPLIKNFIDYRVSNETLLSFDITNNLSFNASLNFLYDAVPPPDVPGLNYFLRNGVTITL